MDQNETNITDTSCQDLYSRHFAVSWKKNAYQFKVRLRAIEGCGSICNKPSFGRLIVWLHISPHPLLEISSLTHTYVYIYIHIYIPIYLLAKLIYEMSTVHRQEHSFSSCERVFSESVEIFETEKVSTHVGLRAPTFGFMLNVLSFELRGGGHTFAIPCLGSLNLVVYISLLVKVIFEMSMHGRQQSFSAHIYIYNIYIHTSTYNLTDCKWKWR